MTQRERIIVSAYTGVLMCDFGLVHKYIEEKMGHPVWTHELRFESTHAEIREKIKPDFIELCGNGDEHGAIADIVAEKRRRADEIERDVSAKMKSGEMVSDRYAREVIEDLRREADRIEAARACEVQSLQGTIVKLNNALAEKQELSANSKSAQIEFGNAAAIRKALVRCADIINKFGLAEIVKTPMEVICDIEGIINAALAAPADESEAAK